MVAACNFCERAATETLWAFSFLQGFDVRRYTTVSSRRELGSRESGGSSSAMYRRLNKAAGGEVMPKIG
jgi:hypothetical protein